MKKLALFLMAISAWGQTTINGDRNISGKLDLTGSTGFIPPSVAADPSGTCTNPVAGEVNMVISQASGNLFTCLSGTWHVGSGATGPQGPQGPAGQALTAKGVWSATTVYSALSTVSYNGALYAAVVANTNVTPGTDATKWNLLGATQTVAVQSGGAAVASQNALNFATPLAAASNAGLSRIDVSCATCESNVNKGAANGYAGLDGTAKLPAAQMPGSFPVTDATFTENNDSSPTQANAPGAVARNVNTKLSDTVDVRDFGAVCNVTAANNNWHDDTAAIQNAINYVSNYLGSGTVHLPSRPWPGGCAVSSTIIIPNGVRLKGDDMHTTVIFAMASFPINTAVVNIGPVCYLSANGAFAFLDAALTTPASPTMRAGMEDVSVSANSVVGSTAVASQTMQENSYLHNVAMYNYDKYGFDCQTYGCQNMALDKVYFIGDSNPNVVHVHFSFANSRINVRDLTITGGAGPSSNNIGVLIEAASEASISDIHCEQVGDCVKVDSGARAEVDNIWGLGLAGGTLPATKTLVHFTSASGGGIVHQAITYGSAVNIQDDLLGQTITDYHVPLHVSVPGENVISSAPSVKNVISSLATNSLGLGNFAINGDPSGGTVLQTFINGLMVQKLTGPSQFGYAGGGLHLLGNGYANDPSWGSVSAGVTTDLGTFTARATSANVIALQSGTIYMTSDTGLTPGNPYPPSVQMAVTPVGVRVLPRTTDPGCGNGNQIGMLWMNTSIVPNTLATCVATSAGLVWQKPVSGVLAAGTALTSRSLLNFTAPFSVADDATLSSTDVTLPQATAATSGYLASSDWSAFSAKSSSGACAAGQFETGDNAAGGPTCGQPAISALSGTASKSQQAPSTVYTDQSNTFSAGTQDFSAAAHTKPVKSGPLASMPTSCASGEFYYATDQQREALKSCGRAGVFQNSSGIVANGLIADYWMSNCDGSLGSGAVLPDCSGNANNATVPTSGNPAWTQQGLTWTTSQNSPVTLPSAVLNGFVTAQVYADMSIANNYNNSAQVQAFLSAGQSAVMWGNVLSSTPLCCGIYGAWAGTTATQEIDPAVGPNLFTYILDSQNDSICIGANCGVSYYSRGGNNPASRVGPLLLGGNNQSGQMTGSMYRVIFYNRALSAAEVAQNDAAIDAWIKFRGVTRGKYAPPISANNLICVGDSITLGRGATPACGSMLSGLSDTFQIYNMGMSGESLANMVTAAPKFATGINPAGKSNIVWIFAGTNDMCGGSTFLTAAQTFQKMVAFSRYMRAQGGKVMVIPMLSRGGTSQNTTCDALHDQYNALLSQNWPSFADSFVYGVLNDPNLTADGAYANATYFQSDGIHPTVAGQQLIAGYTQAEINNLLTGTVNFAGIREAIATKTSSYTASMGDSVLLCNAASGPVTITLPSAVGIQGRAFQIKKTDGSANVCTLTAASGQTIDGAAASTLNTQYATKKVESDNANWQVIQ